MGKRCGRSSEKHPLVIVARATATWHPPNSHRLSHLGYNSQACKHLSGLKIRTGGGEDILVNKEKVILNILCSLKECEKENDI